MVKKLKGFKKIDEVNPNFIQCNDKIVINKKTYIVISTETDFITNKFTMTLESTSKNLNTLK